MDIYTYLKKDHRTVSEMMAQVLAAQSPEQREEIFEEMRHQLTLHAEAEEATFYAALEDEEETEERIEDAEDDHEEIKRSLARLSSMPAENEKWLEIFGELKHAVERHVKEEEGRIFDKAREVLSEREAEMLAQDMEKLKQQTLKKVA